MSNSFDDFNEILCEGCCYPICSACCTALEGSADCCGCWLCIICCSNPSKVSDESDSSSDTAKKSVISGNKVGGDANFPKETQDYGYTNKQPIVSPYGFPSQPEVPQTNDENVNPYANVLDNCSDAPNAYCSLESNKSSKSSSDSD